MPTPPFVSGDLRTRPVTSGMFNPFNGHMMAGTYNVDEVFRHQMSVEDQLHFLYRLFISGQYVDGEKVAEYLNKLYEFCRYLEKYVQELDDREAAHYKELTQKIADLDAKVERYHTELSNRITELDTKVEKYNTEVRKLISDLTTVVNNNYTTLNNKIDQTKTELTTKIDNTKTELTTKIDQTKTDLTNQINNAVKSLTQQITNQGGQVTNIQNSVTNTLKKVYGATYNPDTGEVTLPAGTMIPVANLNFFSATTNPTNSTYANAIRSRALSDNDVKSV